MPLHDSLMDQNSDVDKHKSSVEAMNLNSDQMDEDDSCKHAMPEKLFKKFIILTPIQLCSVKIQKLLEDHNDKILCSEFEAAFVEKYNTPLCPGQYGHPSLNSLIRALPEYFAIKGRGTRKMIWYLRDGSGHGKLSTMPNIFNAPNFNKGMGFYESGIS